MPRAVRKNSSSKTGRAKPGRWPKPLVALWLDDNVIDHFRAPGKGWQARINATLRKAVGI